MKFGVEDHSVMSNSNDCFCFLPQKSEGIAAEAMEAEYLHSISRFYIDVRINDLKKEKKRGKCFGCRRHDCNECRAGCVIKNKNSTI